MSSAGRPAAQQPQDGAEMDSVKESISDIINQLQDIDPARLSFSPFLDLDTQISLARVSDSPESSVEELHSARHSAAASQLSLEPASAADPHGDVCVPAAPGPDDDSRPDGGRTNEPQQGAPEASHLSSPVATTAHSLDDASESRVVAVAPVPLLPPSSPSSPPSPPAADLPNGTEPAKRPRPPPPLHQHHPQRRPADEAPPLLDAPPETVELAVWMDPEGRGQDCDAGAVGVATDGILPSSGRRRCCRTGRGPALCAALASLVCAAGLLYALYFHVPLKAPRCPDPASRVVFTLGCCLLASLPILLAMLFGWLSQFCSGSLEPVEPLSRRRALQKLFVSSSLELLLLYVLNLLLLASQLPQQDLHLVPTMAALFFLGRLVYLASLHTCSAWRAFGSGLTTFPLLAMVSLNLFFLYNLGREYPAFRSQDLFLNRDTPSLWSPGATGVEGNATLETM